MYRSILVTLETTPTDRAIIDHIKLLAKALGSEVVLLHVATGAAAKWKGAEAGGEEIEKDEAYLEQVRGELSSAGISARAELAYGDPVKEIVKWVQQNGCDLIAMSTHGHGVVGDMIHGTTAIRVQHNVSIPVLLLRAK